MIGERDRTVLLYIVWRQEGGGSNYADGLPGGELLLIGGAAASNIIMRRRGTQCVCECECY